MSNPQWSIRLNQTKIDKLNQIINTTYSGDRQKFIDDVFNKLVDNKYPEIHNLVSSIMRFNEAQHTNTDRVVITYRLLYSLLENTRQVAILNYLESNSVLIETHHKKMGLSNVNKAFNSNHRLKYEKTSDKDNNELAKQAKVDQLRLDLKPYLEQCA